MFGHILNAPKSSSPFSSSFHQQVVSYTCEKQLIYKRAESATAPSDEGESRDREVRKCGCNSPCSLCSLNAARSTELMERGSQMRRSTALLSSTAIAILIWFPLGHVVAQTIAPPRLESLGTSPSTNPAVLSPLTPGATVDSALDLSGEPGPLARLGKDLWIQASSPSI